MARRIPMTSLKGHRYANRWQPKGSQFTVPGESDATLLERLGRARRGVVIEQAPVRAVVDVYATPSLAARAVEAARDVFKAPAAAKRPRGRPRKVKNSEGEPT